MTKHTKPMTPGIKLIGAMALTAAGISYIIYTYQARGFEQAINVVVGFSIAAIVLAIARLMLKIGAMKNDEKRRVLGWIKRVGTALTIISLSAGALVSYVRGVFVVFITIVLIITAVIGVSIVLYKLFEDDGGRSKGFRRSSIPYGPFAPLGRDARDDARYVLSVSDQRRISCAYPTHTATSLFARWQ